MIITFTLGCGVSSRIMSHYGGFLEESGDALQMLFGVHVVEKGVFRIKFLTDLECF